VHFRAEHLVREAPRPFCVLHKGRSESQRFAATNYWAQAEVVNQLVEPPRPGNSLAPGWGLCAAELGSRGQVS